jgi:ubiquinone/menaquinone biosynthesis C-methylase UbiE
MKQKQTPFTIENQRAELAQEKNFAELRKLYSKDYLEIPDMNTAKLWNELNVVHRSIVSDNPMEKDRLTKVSFLIRGDKKRILNVGFGSGNLEKIYFQMRPQNEVEWHGIDISPESVKKVSKTHPKGIFKIGNILDLKYPNEYFDCIIGIEILEHVTPSRILKALREVFRVLQPKGYFILSVPLNEGLEDMIFNGKNPNAHVRTYTPDLIKAELQMTGFQIRKEKLLYAFHKHYQIKTLLAKTILKKKFKPNDIILVARKPASLRHLRDYV